MGWVLEGIRHKMARALELLLVLDDELHHYLDSDPFTLQREIHTDGETSYFVLHVENVPPVKLSILAGEVVHQLRSALDHVATGLVLAAGNQPNRRTVFPVLPKRPSRLMISGGVTEAALEAVDRVQPYHAPAPERHPLFVLNRLWNVDKHSNLHLIALLLRQSQIFLEDPNSGAVLGGQLQVEPIGEDGIVGVFRFKDGYIDPKVELTASGQMFVALAGAGPWKSDYPAQLVLEELHQYVTTIVWPPLARLLAVG